MSSRPGITIGEPEANDQLDCKALASPSHPTRCMCWLISCAAAMPTARLIINA